MPVILRFVSRCHGPAPLWIAPDGQELQPETQLTPTSGGS
jgi:hypothetical protein